MENHIIGGAIIERDHKYLLVQEAEDHIDACKGKWGAPGGHVDPGETIMEAAVREVKEETGCEVELTSVCQIGTMPGQNFTFLAIIFTARVAQDVENFASEEIATTRWFTYEEAVALGDQLRLPEWIIHALTVHHEGKVMPLNLINVIDSQAPSVEPYQLTVYPPEK